MRMMETTEAESSIGETRTNHQNNGFLNQKSSNMTTSRRNYYSKKDKNRIKNSILDLTSLNQESSCTASYQNQLSDYGSAA